MLYGKMTVAFGHLQGFVTEYRSNSNGGNPRLGKIGGGGVPKIMEAEVPNICHV